MLNNTTMISSDSVSGRMAQCFVTVDGDRYNFMHMTEFEAKMDKNKVDVPILGMPAMGVKTTGWKGTFTGKAHYNTSIFRRMLAKFKDTGEDTYFEIQVTNEDPTSRVGRQTAVFYRCNLDGGTIAAFNANDEVLQEDVSGTFEDFKLPEEYSDLQGMQQGGR